jgi:hypothetical protein
MMQFKGALLKKVTRPKLADMRVKERLFDNTYVLHLHSLAESYVTSWIFRHNYECIMLCFVELIITLRYWNQEGLQIFYYDVIK